MGKWIKRFRKTLQNESGGIDYSSPPSSLGTIFYLLFIVIITGTLLTFVFTLQDAGTGGCSLHNAIHAIVQAGATMPDDLDMGGHNITDVGSIDAPTGRGSGYVIAASDSTNLEKSQADSICGSDLGTKVNTALAAGYLDIQLCAGTYPLTTTMNLSENSSSLSSNGKAAHIVAAAGLGANNMLYVTGHSATVNNLYLDGNGVASHCIQVTNPSLVAPQQYVHINNLKTTNSTVSDIYFHDSWTNWLNNAHVNDEAIGTQSVIGIQADNTAWGIYIDHPFVTMCSSAHIQVAHYAYIAEGYIGDGDGEGVIIEGKYTQINGGFVADVGKNCVLIRNVSGGVEGTGVITLNGVQFNQASRATDNTYDTIAIEAANAGNTIAKVDIIGCHVEDSFNKVKYGIHIGSFVTAVTIANCSWINGIVAAVYCPDILAAQVKASGNSNWITEDSGYATITAGNTSVIVSHDLDLGGPPLIFLSNFTDSALPAGTYVHDNDNSTFTITINPALGGDYTFRWLARSRLDG